MVKSWLRPCVPGLDIDQREFLSEEPPDVPAVAYDDASEADWLVQHNTRKERLVRETKRQCSFEDFADAVLLFHGVLPIDACRLHVVYRDLRTDLHRWIRRGLARHPAELRVAYDGISHYDDLLFSFDLASGGAGALSVTTRLRTLHLSGLTLSKKLMDELAYECPVLEDLSLVDCEYDYRFQGRIASTSLKRLRIQGLHDSYNSLRFLDTLAFPALVSLNLDKVYLPDIEDELHSLAVASITYPHEEYYTCENRFMQFMRNARVLELRSFTTTGLLAEGPEIFHEFHNLRTLILVECDIGDRCQVMRYVLENVPNLERFVLQDCKGGSASVWCGAAFNGCTSLKSIQVKYKDDDVPLVLVDVLTEIAKDVVKTHHGKRNYAGLLDWLYRVVGWQKKILTQVSAIAQPHNSMPDDEHEFHVWKRHGRKKYDRDCAVKTRRRAAHLGRG